MPRLLTFGEPVAERMMAVAGALAAQAALGHGGPQPAAQRDAARPRLVRRCKGRRASSMEPASFSEPGRKAARGSTTTREKGEPSWSWARWSMKADHSGKLGLPGKGRQHQPTWSPKASWRWRRS